MIIILGPGGTREMVEVSVENGADAVFVGVKNWSRRSHCFEFDDDQIHDCVEYVHHHNKKIFIVMNVIPSFKEMYPFLEKLKKYTEWGIDRVILSDIGIIQLVKTELPHLPIQASICFGALSPEDAKFYKKLGVAMVSLPYVSLDDLARIRQEVDVGLEIFPHGYNNFTYRGKCFMSSYVEHEWMNEPEDRLRIGSFNREGKCHRVCKLPWEMFSHNDKVVEGVTMNSYPYFVLEELPRYLNLGVKCLKVQGRENSAQLAGRMVRFYRELIDRYERDSEHFSIAPPEVERWKKMEIKRVEEMKDRTRVILTGLMNK